MGREEWNEIRQVPTEEGKRPKGSRVAGPEGAPSAIAGTRGFEKTLESWGMIEAFPEPDPYEVMIWERNRR
jgi:hypothetical protein